MVYSIDSSKPTGYTLNSTGWSSPIVVGDGHLCAISGGYNKKKDFLEYNRLYKGYNTEGKGWFFGHGKTGNDGPCMGTGTHCEVEGRGGSGAEEARLSWPTTCPPPIGSLSMSLPHPSPSPPGTPPVPRLPSFSPTLETPYSTKGVVLGVRPHKHIMSVTLDVSKFNTRYKWRRLFSIMTHWQSILGTVSFNQVGAQFRLGHNQWSKFWLHPWTQPMVPWHISWYRVLKWEAWMVKWAILVDSRHWWYVQAKFWPQNSKEFQLKECHCRKILQSSWFVFSYMGKVCTALYFCRRGAKHWF